MAPLLIFAGGALGFVGYRVASRVGGKKARLSRDTSKADRVEGKSLALREEEAEKKRGRRWSGPSPCLPSASPW